MPEGLDGEELRTVQALQAFRWVCPDCDTENFDRASRVAFETPQDEEQVREALGARGDEEGFVVQAPDTVTCRNCLAMFGLE